MRPPYWNFRILLLPVLFCVSLSAQTTPTLSVDVSADRYAINPNIYGMAVNQYATSTLNQEIALPVIRWGGDETSRYNWNLDSSNSGFDFYFMSGNVSNTYTPGGTVDAMISANQPGQSLVTIPIIPFVNSLATLNCSYPTAVYGTQQQTNPYQTGASGTCGNGLTVAGVEIPDVTLSTNNMANSSALQQSWLQHLVNTFGTASQGGVQFYQLDNEPYGWANIHRDIVPVQSTYPQIVALGQQYAAVIKSVDPSAMVLGPSDFTLGGWLGDPTLQNNQYAGIYYLQQMAAYEKTNGTRLLDYFDEHYYFNFTDQASQLASTRTLWDSTYNGGTWIEQYYFDGPMQLIPRFQGWITANYPGTKLSISEYSIDSGNKTVVDALAEMDVLGIFGRQQLDMATMWYPPATTDPIAYSFRMFRNYDGAGSQYGDTWVNAASTDQTQLSIYGAQRTSDNVVTMLVINKTTAPITTTLALTGTTLPTTASVYSYTAANLTQIVSGTSTAITNGTISYNFPAYSATLFTFAPTTSAPAPPPPAPPAPTPPAPTPPAPTPPAPTPASTQTVVAASPARVKVGTSIALKATVSSTSGTKPTGTVSFQVAGLYLGSATTNASGVATVSVPTASFPAGSYSAVASYTGDSSFQASTAAPITLTVMSKTAVNATLAASTTSVVEGQTVTFSVAVAPAGRGPSPTGVVSFNYSGYALNSTNLEHGIATFQVDTAGVQPQVYPVYITYAGDSNYAAATSPTVDVTVEGAPAPTKPVTLDQPGSGQRLAVVHLPEVGREQR